ncbi:MAG: hypothetical protein RBG13Loki_4288, partial [Promethearchaeota archaeon CR_4]
MRFSVKNCQINPRCGKLSNVIASGISIQEIYPSDFAQLCWELHQTQRKTFSNYFEKIIRKKKGTLLAAYDSAGECCGRIAVEFNPGYVSRGHPCATFGWLDGFDSQVVKELLHLAIEWSISNNNIEGGKVRHSFLLRGPISFPKGLGGVGCQVEGFKKPRMYGVSTNRPLLSDWITSASFLPDATYACVEDLNPLIWKSGETISNSQFQLVNFSPTEWHAREKELISLLDTTFGEIFPDTISGRFEESLASISLYQNGKFFWPTALDENGCIAGLLACLPNLWDMWDQKPLASINVDTIIVHPKYRRQG